MIQLKNLPQKYLNIFYVLLSLLMYNATILYKYLNNADFLKKYTIVSQYYFTYQKCGFISRGLIPSLLDFFGINNIISYVVIFNITLVIYVILIIYIAKMYRVKNINLYLVAYLFLFFGVLHFALDIFRLDMLIMMLSLAVLILLNKQKYLIAFLISLLSLLIQEASFFLLIPIFFLVLKSKQRWVFAVSLFIGFLVIILSSNKITEKEAITILQNHNLENIDKVYYIWLTFGIKENIKYVFSTYNVSLYIIYGIGYMIILFYSFKELFISKFSEFRWLFLFPLFLCMVAVDYPRWYCFVYFLAMLYAAKYNLFNKQSFIYILSITLLLGFSNFGFFSYLLILISNKI